MTNPPEWVDQVVEQRLSEMGDDEVAALIAKTRAPKGSHVPNVGQQPNQTPEADHLAALEREGRWGEAGQVKAQQLSKLITEQSRGW